MNFLATCSDVVQFFDASAGVAGTGGLDRSKTCNVAAATTNACCWNHNGQVIATAGDDGSITVLKLNGTVVPAGVLSAYELPIFGIAFSSKSRKLAAGGRAGVVEIWDLKKGNNRVTLRGHRGPVSCLSFFDKDGCVAAGDKSGRVLLHKLDAPPEEEKSPISLPTSEGHAAVTGLAISSFGGPTILASSHADGAARLWDVKQGACVRELRGQHRGKTSGIALHPLNPSLVATVGSDGIVHYTDVRAGEGSGGGGGLRSTETGVPLTCLSFHHEGLALVVGASDGTVRLVDLRSAKQAGRPENAYAGPTPPAGGVRDVRFQHVPHRSSNNASASTLASSTDFSSVSVAGSVSSSSYRATSVVNGHHGVDVPANMATGVSTSETRNVWTALNNGGSRHSTGGPSSAPSRRSATASASAAGVAPSSTTSSRHWPGGKGCLPGSALPATSSERGSSQSAHSSDAHRLGSAEGDGLGNGGEWRATEAGRRESGSDAGGPEVDVNSINGNGHRHDSGRVDDRRTTHTGTDRRHLDKNNHNDNDDDSRSLRPVSSGHGPVSSPAVATSRTLSTGHRRVSHSPERNRREDVPVGWDGRRSSDLNGRLKAVPRSDCGEGGGGCGRGRDDEHFESAEDARFLSQGETAILEKTKGAAKLTVGFRTPVKESGLPTEGLRGSGDSAGAAAGGGGRPGGEGADDGAASSGSVGGVCAGHVVGLERSVLEQMLSSHLSELKEELRKEIRNLHVDVLRQFHSLQDEQAVAMSGFEERLGGLVAENQALRAENDRLRRVY